MSERIAVVTGASSGIGLAVATALATNGDKVVLADINEDAGTREAEKIGGLFIKADLSTRQGCRLLADAVLEKFGGDSVTETRRNFESYISHLNFK